MTRANLGWLRPVAAGAVVAVFATMLSSPANAEDTQETTVAAKPRGITVHGRGFGHGIGMSQYGAEGAARKGISYRKILKYYYPNTRLRKRHRFIKVHITADKTDPVAVRAARGLRVRDRRDGRMFRLPNRQRIRKWRLKAAPRRQGRTVVQYYARGEWRRWRVPKRKTLRGAGTFRRKGPLRLILPGGRTRPYRGGLRAAKPKRHSGHRDTVNVLRLQHYLKGVVPREMPASWSRGALRAQSVAARSYALYLKRNYARTHYDLCDTTACQVYRGRRAEDRATNAAVRATRGVTVTHRGKAALTMFSSSSGGWTAAGNKPYLRAHRDRHDRWSGNPMRSWRVRIRGKQIRRAYPKIGRFQRAAVIKRNGKGAWGGRAVRVRLKGKRGVVRVSGVSFRSTFGLRSDWFRF